MRRLSMLLAVSGVAVTLALCAFVDPSKLGTADGVNPASHGPVRPSTAVAPAESIGVQVEELYAGVDFTTASVSIASSSALAHYFDEVSYSYVPGAISLLAGADAAGGLLLEEQAGESATVRSEVMALTGLELASGDSLYISVNTIYSDESESDSTYAFLVDHDTFLKWRMYVDPWGAATTRIVTAASLAEWGWTSSADTTVVQPDDESEFWCGHWDLIAGSARGVRATSTGYNTGVMFNTFTSTMPDYTDGSRRGFFGWNMDDISGKRVLSAHLSVGWGGTLTQNSSRQVYAILDTLSADSLRTAPTGLNAGYHSSYWRSTSTKFMHEADTDTAASDDGDAANVTWHPTIASRTSDAAFGIVSTRPMDEDYTVDSVVNFDVKAALNTALNIGYGPQAWIISGTPRSTATLAWDIGGPGAADNKENMGPVLTVAYIEEDDPPDPYVGMLKWGNAPAWNDYFYDHAAKGGVYVGQLWDLWDESGTGVGLVDSLRSRNPDIKLTGYSLSLAVNHGRLLNPPAGLLGDIHRLCGRHLVYTVDQDTFLHWQYDDSAPDAVSDYDHYLFNYVECATLADSLALLYKQYRDASSNGADGVGIYIDTMDFPLFSGMYADTTSPRWGSAEAGKLLWRGAADMDQDGTPHDIDADEQAAFLAAMIALPARMRAILGDETPVVANGMLPYQFSAMRQGLDGMVFDGFPDMYNSGDAYKPYNRAMDMRVDDPDSSWSLANSWPAEVGLYEWSPITEGLNEQITDLRPSNISVNLPRRWNTTNHAYIPAATIINRMFAEAGAGPYLTYTMKSYTDNTMSVNPIWRADFGDPVGPVVCSDPDGKMETGDTLTRQFERGTLVITQGDGTLASPFTWSFTWR